MRVFYAVRDHYWEDANLLTGLEEAGHEVVRHDPGHTFHEALGPDWTEADRARVSERLVEAVRAEHARRPLDLFFSYLLKQLVYPEAIREIGRLGIPTVNYWCNGAHQFYLVDEISPAFDYCVATEREALPQYKAVGAKPIYLQMAANPRLYRPHDVPREYDVTFVGQRYADRPTYVLHLLKNDIDVRVWGPGWTPDRTFGEKRLGMGVSWRYLLRHPRASFYKLLSETRKASRRHWDYPPWDERRLARAAGPSLPYEELVRMYSRSRISLGFSTCGDARYTDKDKIRQIHLRDFEAPMSGAFYFVEYQEELRDFYEIGQEIVCYTSREDLLDKVRYYLARPAEAERIRQAGYRRAQADHTWARRFERLFDEMGLRTKREARAVG
jgi:spore maturation protein CgeB